MEIKQGIRRNFARRAGSYDQHANVQRFMAQRLLALVMPCLSRAASILEIGCGTGYFTQQLRQINPGARMVALDLDTALVSAARRRLGPDSRITWLVADGEALGRGNFEVIISNATFQWLTRPGATLAAYSRSLKTGGTLAFSTLGPRTFQELSASWQQAGHALNFKGTPPIVAQTFLNQEAWRGLLRGAGFSRVRLIHELVSVSFPSVTHFLKALQATGATNPQPRPFSPRLLAAMTVAYRSAFAQNGSIPVTYETIWVLGRKPDK